jgi:hypothetical protein
LKRKAREKLAHFPEQATFSEADLARVRSFADFDSLYTGPAHGYGDAEGYWRHGSCRPVLPHIAQPALLISAADDPFFGPACFPVEEAQRSRHFHFWHTPYGGHVGFVLPGFRGGWHEGAAIRFLKAFLE